MEYFITAAGVPVHVSDNKKDGIAILFLHGYFETLYIWDDFTPFFPPDTRIISIDLPGHGLSGYPSIGFDLDFCSVLIQELLTRLRVEKCHIVTHNCSFYIASHFSSLYSYSVLSITDICSNLFINTMESSFIHFVKASLHEGTFMKSVSHIIPKMYYEDNLRACDGKIQETIAICETHDPDGILGFLDAILNYDNRPLIQIPLLTIVSQYSLFRSLESSSSDDVLLSSGMNPFIEKPFETYQRISSFINI